jgi:hypothetical protein
VLKVSLLGPMPSLSVVLWPVQCFPYLQISVDEKIIGARSQPWFGQPGALGLEASNHYHGTNIQALRPLARLAVQWAVELSGGQSHYPVASLTVWWIISLFSGRSHCLVASLTMLWTVSLSSRQYHCLVASLIAW